MKPPFTSPPRGAGAGVAGDDNAATGQTLFPLISIRSITVNHESLLQGRRQGNLLHAGKEAARQASTLRAAMTCLRQRAIMIIPTMGS